MHNLRKYGEPPFALALLHGGPGAGGEMAPVARQLSSSQGVLEPIQTATSLDEQVEELRTVLEENGDLPVTLVGFSWGAWLGFILAAAFPELVRKLILVGSGPFEEKYTPGMRQAKLKRLSVEEKSEIETLTDVLGRLDGAEKDAALARCGLLFEKASAYDPMPYKSAEVDVQADIFQSVWKDGAELRKSGKLLQLGQQIQCPVVALHGDYDPHPAIGVQEPLSAMLDDFHFILLEHCGHKPWIEREARDEFYRILKEELAASSI